MFAAADYPAHFYSALSQAGYCDSAPAGERQRSTCSFSLRIIGSCKIWAANCPENFENRAPRALVGAEIARACRRAASSMPRRAPLRGGGDPLRARQRLHMHNEALANELASRFYAGGAV